MLGEGALGNPGTGQHLCLDLALLASSEPMGAAQSTRDFLERPQHCGEVYSERKQGAFISREQWPPRPGLQLQILVTLLPLSSC